MRPTLYLLPPVKPASKGEVLMERFGISGLWKHTGSTVVAGLLPIVDVTLSYLNVVSFPAWAHALVGLASLAFGAYKGKLQALVAPAPPPPAA